MLFCVLKKGLTPTIRTSVVFCHILNKCHFEPFISVIVQELCESRGDRPGLSVLTSLLVSVDIKLY